MSWRPQNQTCTRHLVACQTCRPHRRRAACAVGIRSARNAPRFRSSALAHRSGKTVRPATLGSLSARHAHWGRQVGSARNTVVRWFDAVGGVTLDSLPPCDSNRPATHTDPRAAEPGRQDQHGRKVPGTEHSRPLDACRCPASVKALGRARAKRAPGPTGEAAPRAAPTGGRASDPKRYGCPHAHVRRSRAGNGGAAHLISTGSSTRAA